MKIIIFMAIMLISFKGNSQSGVDLITDSKTSSSVYFEINDSKNRISLCGEYPLLYDLKSVVEKLYKEKRITLAGKTIIWRKGYPVWGPYSSHGPGYRTQKLFFGYVKKIKGDTCYVEGDSKKTFFYPYVLK